MDSIDNEDSAMKAFDLWVDSSPVNFDNLPGTEGAVLDHIPFPPPGDVNLELVKNEDFKKPGGKFRSILRLSVIWYIRSERRFISTLATGWLIEKDILVTAAHCVQHRDRGNALSLTATMGYAGPDPDRDGDPDYPLVVPDLQRRGGRVVVLPAKWSVTYSPEHDLAFVRLDAPFELPGAQLLRYEQPPEWNEWSPEEYEARKSGLLVVGYPGATGADNERFLHRLCSSRGEFWEWDPRCELKDDCPGTLLFNRAFIYPGMSGPPVLWFKNGYGREDDSVVIGTAVCQEPEFSIASEVGTDRNGRNEFPMYIGLLNDIQDGWVDINSGSDSGSHVKAFVRQADGSFTLKPYYPWWTN